MAIGLSLAWAAVHTVGGAAVRDNRRLIGVARRVIVTVQFVRSEHLGWHLLVPGGGPLKRTPGPVDELPLVSC